MSYDDSFYQAYRDYLQEPSVRRAHDHVLGFCRTLPSFRNVVDLGCGRFNEFLHFAKPRHYVGIDANAAVKCSKRRRLIAADYRQPAMVAHAVSQFGATAFVSLFSSEITAPVQENYAFYEQLFCSFPTLQAGLVSGFYYFRNKEENPIGQTGGIVSYQSLEPIESVRSPLFVEARIIIPAPSKMFGDDVIEVWKLLEAIRKTG